MLSRICAALVVLSAASIVSSAQVTAGKPVPPTVTVQVNAAGNLGTVSPRMFGTFIEPIDNSINNGVSAEILVNGSLEGGLWNHAMLEAMFRDQPELIDSTNTTGVPLPWRPMNAAGNRFELHVGQAANSWQSLELLGLPGQAVGIMQRIYLPVPRALTYRVSFYAKCLTGNANVDASLRSTDGTKIFASAKIATQGEEWTKYTADLTLQPGDVRRLEPVTFAVSLNDASRVELDQLSLMPNDAVDGFDPSVLQMAADMHMTELRYGGNFSSAYHWRDGIGPVDRRVTQENIAWGIPEYNNFGTDEFIDFCNRVHAEPQFNINLGSGTPAEAADWVRYIRERYHSAMVFELGNELYGKWQVGYPTLEEIAPRTLAFSQLLRPLTEGDTVMATGAIPTRFEKWNGKQLGNPPGTFDLLTTHFIVATNHVALRSATPDFTAAAAYAVPFAVGDRFDAMQAQVDNTVGYKNAVHFAITEWLYNNKGNGERNFTNESPSSRNEGGAVMIASTFNTFFRHNRQIQLVDMTGLMEFAGIWKRKEQVFATPAYYAFRMYATAKGQTVLPVSSDSGTYSVQNGTEGYESVTDVPYIDVAATRSADGNTLTLFCVNRSLDLDVPTHIEITGFQAADIAKVESLSAISRYVMNDEVEPEQVVPRPSSIAVRSASETAITLPHESVTVIHLRKK